MVYNESWPSINQCSILIIMWRNYKKKEKKKPLFEVEGVKVKKKPDLVDKLDRIFSLFIRYRDTMPNGYFQCISCGKIKPFNKAAVSYTHLTGVDLDRAIKQMTGVKSREELERVWAEHPELHNNKEFRNITIDMQKTYPPRN